MSVKYHNCESYEANESLFPIGDRVQANDENPFLRWQTGTVESFDGETVRVRLDKGDVIYFFPSQLRKELKYSKRQYDNALLRLNAWQIKSNTIDAHDDQLTTYIVPSIQKFLKDLYDVAYHDALKENEQKSLLTNKELQTLLDYVKFNCHSAYTYGVKNSVDRIEEHIKALEKIAYPINHTIRDNSFRVDL